MRGGVGSHEGFDPSLFKELASGPGVDTRQWVSYGIVAQESGDAHSVRFQNDDGTTPDEQVLVDVTLQPSGIDVVCRVAMGASGAGEGEHVPLGPGDEVIVLIPEGNERAGCVVVGRLPNKYDVLPTTVAGVDVTQNNVAFRRTKVPYILASASGILIAQETAMSQLALNAAGEVLLTDGEGNALGMNASVCSWELGDGSAGIQMVPTASGSAQTPAGLMLFAGGTTLVVGDQETDFQTAGTLAFATSGMGATGHAVTVEQVAVMLQGLLQAFAAVLAPVASPLTGTSLAALFSTPALAAPIVAAAVPIAVALPVAPLNASLLAALSTPGDPTGSIPGVGKPGLMF